MARILVADDEEGIRSFIADVLEEEGHVVVPASDGQAAIERLGRESFHLLVTDLKMPRLDGMALLEKARASWPEMEIIVLTAHGTVESAVQAMKQGAFDYLQKPIASPTELRLLVARAAAPGAGRSAGAYRAAQRRPSDLGRPGHGRRGAGHRQGRGHRCDGAAGGRERHR